jgi:hypothetical protein
MGAAFFIFQCPAKTPALIAQAPPSPSLSKGQSRLLRLKPGGPGDQFE